jgi:hypothetical protein
MPDETLVKRFCIVVQLRPDTDLKRLSEDFPKILGLFNRLSDGKVEQIFRSSDGTLFGYFLKTATLLQFIRAEFDKLDSTVNGDAFLIYEVGEQFAGLGFSRAWTWLQHH